MLLRAHTLALAAGQEPEAIAHRGAVLSQAGIFDSQGFPKPAPEPKEGPARGERVAQPAGGGGSPWRRGLVAAAFIGTVAFVLIDNSGHGKQAAGHPADSVPPTGASAAAPFGASPGTSPTNSATRTAAKATANDHRLRHDRAAGHAYCGQPCDDTGRSPVRDDQSDRDSHGIHSDADRQGHPGNPFRLPVGRRAVGTSGRHHDLADRARRPGDLVEHRVQRVRHGAAQPLRRNDQCGRRPLP